MAVTWALWTPLREPPRLPPAAFPIAPPPGFDFALLPLVALGVAARRPGLAVAALAALMAGDQLRWQPWAYHALLIGVLLAACGAARATTLARWLAVSVYAYSAIAKLDATYATTLGQQVLDALGASAVGLPEGARAVAALAPPLAELGVAACLAASLRWRSLARPAAAAAVAMHLGTIGVLGPWGLGHSAGVLLWNVGFAWQTVVLFGTPPGAAGAARNESFDGVSRVFERAATAVVCFALVAPLASPLGGWDRWPSWGLYAPGGERAAVHVHRSVVDRLPDAIPIGAEADGPWRRVRLDQWVLRTTGAPLYPQNRVRLALAAALAERFPLSDRVMAIVESRADRFTGERESRVIEGAEIGAASGAGR